VLHQLVATSYGMTQLTERNFEALVEGGEDTWLVQVRALSRPLSSSSLIPI